MSINKEWRCAAHGPFENNTGACPYGCTIGIERRFYTPVGISTGGRTKAIDNTLAGIAEAYGLSDMNNHGGTTAARIPSPQEKMVQAHNEEIRKRFPSPWGMLPSAKQGGAVAAMQEYGNPAPVDMKSLTESAPRKAVIGKRSPDEAADIKKVKAA